MCLLFTNLGVNTLKLVVIGKYSIGFLYDIEVEGLAGTGMVLGREFLCQMHKEGLVPGEVRVTGPHLV